MTIEFDPYSILGISSSASLDDIKGAYRRIAKRLHPDANRDHPGAQVQFQDVTSAYELLIDPIRRQKYDESSRSRSEQLQFSMRTIPSKKATLPLEESQVVYLLTEITPDPRVQQVKRETRLNLTLVLDHSNSMNGNRLDRVKVAAHQIIDQLNPDDIFSVVAFNDRATIIIEATTVQEKASLKAKISMILASGGTEIFQGLEAGVDQNMRFLAPRLVNHIVLLTDGHTFGDQDKSLQLAQTVAKKGITISAMGLGQDWNDEFLEKLASTTGGSCTYINSASAVVRFLNDHVRSLSNIFAERVQLSIAPDPDIRLEYAFKLAPSPQPLAIDQAYIPLGSMQVHRPISVLLQFELPANMNVGFRSLARLACVGDILENRLQKFHALNDLSLEISQQPAQEPPPTAILDALGKLTLYRMQERAQEAAARGDYVEATKRLERLATRFLELGEGELAAQAKLEAQNISQTNQVSEKGRKTLKFHTRTLMLGPKVEDKA